MGRCVSRSSLSCYHELTEESSNQDMSLLPEGQNSKTSCGVLCGAVSLAPSAPYYGITVHGDDQCVSSLGEDENQKPIDHSRMGAVLLALFCTSTRYG
jgi:hypothetical protein